MNEKLISGAFICVDMLDVPRVQLYPARRIEPNKKPGVEDIARSIEPIPHSNHVFYVNEKGHLWIMKDLHSTEKIPKRLWPPQPELVRFKVLDHYPSTDEMFEALRDGYAEVHFPSCDPCDSGVVTREEMVQAIREKH